MGEKLTFLAGIEPVLHMYVKKKKRKSFLVGSNHKNVAMHCIVRSRARCLLRYGDMCDIKRYLVKVIRNPLGLKSEVK